MDYTPAVQGRYFPSMPPMPGVQSRLLDSGYGPPPPISRIPTSPTPNPDRFSPGMITDFPQFSAVPTQRIPSIPHGNSNPFLQSDINNVRTKIGYLQYNINELRYNTDILYDRMLAQRSWVNQMQYNLNDAESALNALSNNAL